MSKNDHRIRLLGFSKTFLYTITWPLGPIRFDFGINGVLCWNNLHLLQKSGNNFSTDIYFTISLNKSRFNSTLRTYTYVNICCLCGLVPFSPCTQWICTGTITPATGIFGPPRVPSWDSTESGFWEHCHQWDKVLGKPLEWWDVCDLSCVVSKWQWGGGGGGVSYQWKLAALSPLLSLAPVSSRTRLDRVR